MAIGILFSCSLLFTAILLIFKSKTLNKVFLIAFAWIHLAVSVFLYFYPGSFTEYFKIDSLNILFILVLSLVYVAATFSHTAYMKKAEIKPKWNTYSAVFMILFVTFMTGVLLTTHAALVWVFVEATSLMAAPLIYFSQSRTSLEASWKYIFICSIGISIAFVGIIFISIGSGPVDSLFFEDLYKNADKITPFWLKLSFPLILVGLGTKMGLAPGHSWLPDAHSESPHPVSAMLSASLLNASLLGILRFFKILEKANMAEYAKTMIFLMGFLSVFIGAVFIIRSKNYKRMLAYSSIEHMGIISIGVATGGASALFGSLLHIISHSFSKAAFFLTTGNIISLYKTKKIAQVRGLIRKDRKIGWIWILCFIAIAGLPPFPLFLSEYFIIKGMFEQGFSVLAILLLLFLTLILYGFSKNIFKMTFGQPLEQAEEKKEKLLLSSYLPQIVLIAILFLIGIGLPSFVYEMISIAIKAL